MRDPIPGLRPFRNKSNDVAKVSLVIPVGEVLEVSEEVARQLGSAFAPVEAAAAEESAKPARRGRKTTD